MKILRLLSSLHHNEDERSILKLTRSLVKQGHQSLIIASTDPNHEFAERLKEQGSSYTQLYLEKNSWLTLISVFGVWRQIRQFRPDIIHIHSRTPAWIVKWALNLIAEDYRPITVATIYGYYPVNAYNKAIFDVDHLISVSNSVSAHIKQHHKEYDDGRITRIYRGVDSQKYVYRHQPSVHWLHQVFAEYPELEHKKWLIFPYEIDGQTGQHWLIDIIGNLKHTMPNLHIVIMDDDSNPSMYFEEFVQRLTALNLQKYMTFIGKRDDVREWLCSASLVLGLANEPESIGMSVLKAVHLGTPVVAWHHGIYKELLRQLYPQGLVHQQTAHALCEVVQARLDAKERPALTTQFSQKQTVEQIIALYERLLATRENSK
ncbi:MULTISPECIES: glycosyltransferase [unclassified Moraxella]|uniref:glycosyltransferase n=1 Tax=unclassified Moraxella TaxID=2685852 RepID=UPI003AF70D9D